MFLIFILSLLLDDKISETFNELVKWVDVSDAKVSVTGTYVMF